MNPEFRDKNQIDLEAFRQEIESIQKEESERGKTGHFEGAGFKAEDLTLEDMDFWHKIKNGTVARDAFDYYRHRLKETELTPSRKIFAAFAANKANVVIGRRELEEREIRNDPRR